MLWPYWSCLQNQMCHTSFFQIHRMSVTVKEGNSLVPHLLGFLVMRCRENFSFMASLSTADTLLHYPAHHGIIAPAHQLIAIVSFLSLSIRLVIGCRGETCLLCILAWPSLSDLLDQLTLLLLPDWHGPPLLIVWTGLFSPSCLSCTVRLACFSSFRWVIPVQLTCPTQHAYSIVSLSGLPACLAQFRSPAHSGWSFSSACSSWPAFPVYPDRRMMTLSLRQTVFFMPWGFGFTTVLFLLQDATVLLRFQLSSMFVHVCTIDWDCSCSPICGSSLLHVHFPKDRADCVKSARWSPVMDGKSINVLEQHFVLD